MDFTTSILCEPTPVRRSRHHGEPIVLTSRPGACGFVLLVAVRMLVCVAGVFFR